MTFRSLLGVAAVCLLSFGCASPGAPTPISTDGFRLLPMNFGSRSDKALEKAVENDPFPRADQIDLRA